MVHLISFKLVVSLKMLFVVYLFHIFLSTQMFAFHQLASCETLDWHVTEAKHDQCLLHLEGREIDHQKNQGLWSLGEWVCKKKIEEGGSYLDFFIFSKGRDNPVGTLSLFIVPIFWTKKKLLALAQTDSYALHFPHFLKEINYLAHTDSYPLHFLYSLELSSSQPLFCKSPKMTSKKIIMEWEWYICAVTVCAENIFMVHPRTLGAIRCIVQ